MLREDDESVCVDFFFLSHGAWAFTDSVSVHSILRTVSALLSLMSSYVISGGSADCGASHTLSVGCVYTTPAGVSTSRNHVPGTPSASSKQWFMTILPRCHDLTAQLTLTVQKELQISAIKVGITADQLRTAFSAPPAIAGGVLLLVPSPVSMSPSDEE